MIGRFDRLDPDSRIASNSIDRLIAGVACEPNRRVATLLTYVRVRYDAGAAPSDESRILLQAEVRY